MQLEMFPRPMQQESEKPSVWEELEGSVQAILVASLARLMAKTIQREAKEKEDER